MINKLESAPSVAAEVRTCSSTEVPVELLRRYCSSKPLGHTYGFLVRIVPEDDGFYAEGMNLPGAVSEGETKEEALKNITEALQALVASYKESGEEIPWSPAPQEQHPKAEIHWVTFDA
jgi:predicted RNase H-like HicB family nuclease